MKRLDVVENARVIDINTVIIAVASLFNQSCPDLRDLNKIPYYKRLSSS